MKATPLQAMKFASRLNNNMGMRFITDFMAEHNMSGWKITVGNAVDTTRTIPGQMTFAEFCKLNPDEPEREDGRKLHYGTGRQPLDDIIDAGWGGAFCAGNVLKYLRRNKQVEDSCTKARWYWRKLNEITFLTFNGALESREAMAQLIVLLSPQERDVLDGGPG